MLPADTVKAHIIKKMLFKQGNDVFKKISLIASTKIRMHWNGLTACSTKITVYIKGTIPLFISSDKLITLIPTLAVQTLSRSTKRTDWRCRRVKIFTWLTITFVSWGIWKYLITGLFLGENEKECVQTNQIILPFLLKVNCSLIISDKVKYATGE